MSSKLEFEIHPFFNFSSPSNSFLRETWPFDSPDSYKLIGYILKVEILSVPVCLDFTFLEVELVKMNCPGLDEKLQRLLTASHMFGVSCHSSINLGFSPLSKELGFMFAAKIIFYLFDFSCSKIALLALQSAVVVLPQNFGPTIFIDGKIPNFLSNVLSAILEKYFI